MKVMSYVIPMSTELMDEYADLGNRFRYRIWGTSGDRLVDARLAAEYALAALPVQTWENEGGAL